MAAAPDATLGAPGGAPVVALAAEGDKLVAGSADGAVRLWDAASGASLVLAGHSGAVAGVAVSNDLLVSAAWDGELRLWAPS